MRAFSEIELREAARAIASTRMKSEKAILKLKQNSAQQRLTARGIAAYALALVLIGRELGKAAGEYTSVNEAEPAYTKEALVQASEAFSSATTRVENILPKFASGTPQHTLAVRRLRAFEIASVLIRREQART